MIVSIIDTYALTGREFPLKEKEEEMGVGMPWAQLMLAVINSVGVIVFAFVVFRPADPSGSKWFKVVVAAFLAVAAGSLWVGVALKLLKLFSNFSN